MSQKQRPNLAATLAEAGGSARRRAAPSPLRAAKPAGKQAKAPATAGEGSPQAQQQPSRSGTAPITGHFPKQVRDQLKILAVEQNSALYNLMAEAYNDLFAKYSKPEIAPHQAALRE